MSEKQIYEINKANDNTDLLQRWIGVLLSITRNLFIAFFHKNFLFKIWIKHKSRLILLNKFNN